MKKNNPDLNVVTITLPKQWATQWRKPKPLGQLFAMPSMTTPDMALSLVELIERFASGSPLNVGQKVYYDGSGEDVIIDDDILQGVNWNTLDLVEKHEILKKAKSDFSKINEGIKLGVKKRAEELEKIRKAKAERDEQIEKLLKKDNPIVTPYKKSSSDSEQGV